MLYCWHYILITANKYGKTKIYTKLYVINGKKKQWRNIPTIMKIYFDDLEGDKC